MPRIAILKEQVVNATPPDRLLLCLHPSCHGEFYYPLTSDESISCPYDRTHDVAVYSGPTTHGGDREIESA